MTILEETASLVKEKLGLILKGIDSLVLRFVSEREP
jgi:hypothetical protein